MLTDAPHPPATGPQGPGRAAQAVAPTALAALALVLLVLVLTGRVTSYVRPSFAPLLLVTALVLAVLAMSRLLDVAETAGAGGPGAPSGAAGAPGDGRRDSQRSHHPHAGQPEQPGQPRGPRRTSLGGRRRRLRGWTVASPTAWLLLVPVLLAALAAPAPLGSSMMDSSAAVTISGAPVGSAARDQARAQAAQDLGLAPDGTVAYPELPARQATEMTLEELHNRHAYGAPSALDGRGVVLTGFASPAPGGGWVLGRFKIYCCAADALAYQVLLASPPGGLTADQWYRVTGVVRPSTQAALPDGQDLPVVEVTRAEPIDQPATPYL